MHDTETRVIAMAEAVLERVGGMPGARVGIRLAGCTVEGGALAIVPGVGITLLSKDGDTVLEETFRMDDIVGIAALMPSAQAGYVLADDPAFERDLAVVTAAFFRRDTSVRRAFAAVGFTPEAVVHTSGAKLVATARKHLPDLDGQELRLVVDSLLPHVVYDPGVGELALADAVADVLNGPNHAGTTKAARQAFLAGLLPEEIRMRLERDTRAATVTEKQTKLSDLPKDVRDKVVKQYALRRIEAEMARSCRPFETRERLQSLIECWVLPL